MLTSEQIRKAELNATLSSCCGVTGEAVLTDSAVILLYAAALNAGDSLSILATAVLPFLNGLLILPMAGLAPHCGCRRLVLGANVFAISGYVLAACAAFFPDGIAAWIMMAGILMFAVCQTGFVAGWFPFLDTFLPPESRTKFLGWMRFCHQMSAIIFLGITSLIIGKTPGIHVLQLVIGVGALVFAGRIFFIHRIPDYSNGETRNVSWWSGLKRAYGNKSLKVFSIYTFCLNLGVFAVIPVMLIYLKNRLHLPSNQLVLISAAAFAGMSAGYFSIARIEKKIGRFLSFVMLHVIFLITLPVLIFLPSGTFGMICAVCGLFLWNGCIAANSVIAGSEMMQRANPDNKTMAMAFWGMSYSCGSGGSRLLSAFLLPWVPMLISPEQCCSLYPEQLILGLCMLITVISLLILPVFKQKPERKFSETI